MLEQYGLAVDKAVCLVLDKRIDMWNGLDEECQRHGILAEPFFCGCGDDKDIEYDHIDTEESPPVLPRSTSYPTWWNRPNAYNAWQCHKKILQRARADGTQSLLLLEDDSIFESDFHDVMKGASLENWQFDMLYLGWYSNGHLHNTPNKHVMAMRGGGGFHGVILNRRIIELLAAVDPIGPYDWICGQIHHKKMNCYAIYPDVITQQDGHSYVEGHHLTKPRVQNRAV